MKECQRDIRHSSIRWAAVAAILLLIAISTVPATAEPLPQNRHIFVSVANDAGVKYDLDGAVYGTEGNNNTYYIKADGGGLNELHITADPSDPYGQVTTSGNQSGTFYLSNTGGRGFDDTIVLLLAVNGTVPDDFAVHIRSSGYNWTQSTVVNQAPTDYTYIEGALDETFTKEDFIYGPQTWKPGPGAMGPVGLPLYEEHDIGDTNNTFNLMFIDLNAGNLKKDAIKFPDLSDEGQGAVKVEYSFENLETFAAFNAYGWCLAANQGQGISWTNRLNPAGQTAPGSSGYAVVGIPSVLSTVSIDPEAATTVMGKTLQFTPTALDQKGRQMKDIVFDWASSNEAIGTVNETGYFTALEPGVTTVTASHGEVTGSALVTVIPPQVSSGSSGGGHTSTSVGAASNLKPGESVTLPMSMTAISAVTFTAKNEVKDIMATVAQGSLPRDAEPPAGTVYQYVQATLYKAAETDLTAVQFRFTVPTTWLVEHGCTPEQVTLLRHTADGWQAVPVEALGEENGNAIFSASPDGFSLFAIAATGEVTSVTGDATPQETPAETPTETATTAPASDKTPATPQATPLPVWAAALAFGVLLLARRT